MAKLTEVHQRDGRLAAALVDRQGCPAAGWALGEVCGEGDGTVASRLEAFDHFAPAGRVYRTVRCVECGEQVMDPDPGAEGPAAA